MQASSEPVVDTLPSKTTKPVGASLNLSLDQRPFAEVGEAATDSSYRPISYWHETVSMEPGVPLEGSTTCDVVIVGGGFSGLSTACELKRARPDLDVVVLEREVVGHGASGRNGGFAMPLLGWDLTYAVDKLGEQTARDAYALMYDAVAELKRTVAEEKIACDLEATGYLLLSTSKARTERVREEVALGRRLGFDLEWLEGDALSGHVKSDAFRGGLFDPHPAILNPAKLVRGLLDVAKKLGVRVYERTPVTSMGDGDTVRVATSSGSVSAKAAVLAVNGYGAALGFMSTRILPIHTYIVLTEPLSEAQIEAIGWTKRTSLETARNFIHYFRLTADNRILFGGEDAKLFWGGRYRDVDEATFSRLEATLAELFPALEGVEITHRWGGALGVTFDMFPSMGVRGARDNVFYATGYSGHGVALANYAGKILAPRILDRLGLPAPRDRPTPFFYGRKPRSMLGPLVRFLGTQVYRWGMQAQDRWQRA